VTEPTGACPRCGAGLRDDQDWCLDCGAAARTRLARAPAWRAPIALVAILIALSGAALAFAFVRLANTDDDVRAARSAATATQPAPAVTAPATTATAPAVAVPPATTPDTQPTAPRPSPFSKTTTTP
jgi:hypothetical protein